MEVRFTARNNKYTVSISTEISDILLLGWLETRPAQIMLNYLKHKGHGNHFMCIKVIACQSSLQYGILCYSVLHCDILYYLFLGNIMCNPVQGQTKHETSLREQTGENGFPQTPTVSFPNFMFVFAA